MQQRGEQDRRLLTFEEEVKKLESKLLVAIREKSGLAANVASYERQLAELKKANEFLKTKVSCLCIRIHFFHVVCNFFPVIDPSGVNRRTLWHALFFLYIKVSADTTKKKINALTMELIEAKNKLDAKDKVHSLCVS